LPRNTPKEVVDKKIDQEIKTQKKIEVSSKDGKAPLESFWIKNA